VLLTGTLDRETVGCNVWAYTLPQGVRRDLLGPVAPL